MIAQVHHPQIHSTIYVWICCRSIETKNKLKGLLVGLKIYKTTLFEKICLNIKTKCPSVHPVCLRPFPLRHVDKSSLSTDPSLRDEPEMAAAESWAFSVRTKRGRNRLKIQWNQESTTEPQQFICFHNYKDWCGWSDPRSSSITVRGIPHACKQDLPLPVAKGWRVEAQHQPL